MQHADTSIWRLPQRAAPSPITEAQKEDFTRLLELVAKHWPALMCPRTSAASELTNIDTARLLVDALSNDGEVKNHRWTHNKLVQCIRTARKITHINIPEPQFAIPLPYETPAITLKKMIELPAIRELEKRFVASLHALNQSYLGQAGQDLDLAALLRGQLLFSAARFGGLVHLDALNGVRQALIKRKSKHLLWTGVQLVVSVCADDEELRRWTVDALTAALFLRLRTLNRKRLHRTRRSVEDCLDYFIRWLESDDLLPHLPVTAFLHACSSVRALELRPYLHAWESGRNISVPWSLKSERRVRLGIRHPLRSRTFTDEQGADSQVKTLSPIPRSCNRIDVLHAYSELRNCIPTDRHKWRRAVDRNLDTWFTTHEDKLAFIPLAVAEWLRALVAKPGLPGHERIMAPNSVSTYLSRIGRSLFAASAELEFVAYDDEEFWRSLYAWVLTAHRGSAPRRRQGKAITKGGHPNAEAIRECQSFHDFMVQRYGIPNLNILAEFGLAHSDTMRAVNANYITPDEFKTSYNLLDAKGKDRRSAEILNCGYWSGLRISEMLGLRFRDIRGIPLPGNTGALTYPELLVRTHRWRGLKTSSSTRHIQLDAVMPSEYLDKFMTFYRTQLDAARISNPQSFQNDYIFAEIPGDKTIPDDHPVRGAMQKVLRYVTGDSTVVVHHLRHSAANNLLLMLSADGDNDKVWRLFHEPPIMLIRLSNSLRERLGIHKLAQRPILWIVSGLLGHADPTVTLGSYIHMLHWLIECNASAVSDSTRYVGLTRSIKLDAAVLGISEERARRWRQKHVKPGPTRAGRKPRISQERDIFVPHAQYWARVLRLRPPRRQGYEVTRAPARWPRPAEPAILLPTIDGLRVLGQHVGDPNIRISQLGAALSLPTNVIYAVRHADEAMRSEINRTLKKRYRQRSEQTVDCMPTHPAISGDIEDFKYLWGKFSDNPAINKLYSAFVRQSNVELRQTATNPFYIKLEHASDAFVDGYRQYSHVLSYHGMDGAGLRAARTLLDFLGSLYPPDCIEIEARLRKGATEKSAALSLHRKLGRGFRYLWTPTEHWRRSMPDWNDGAVYIKLLTRQSPYKGSYGAWYALYWTCLFGYVFDFLLKDQQFEQGATRAA